MKRFLYTVAVLNTALLGVCAYLFLAPSSGGSGTVPVFTASKSFAPASAIPDQPGLAGAAFQPRSIQPAPDSVPGREPAARVVLAASVSGEPDGRPAQPGRVTDSWSSDPEENSVHDSGPVMLAPTILEAATSTQSAVHIGSASFAAAVTSPAAASDVRAPAVPLAFTTSANGATPSQAAALGRLQQGFVNDLGGQNQNPNTPAYAQSWQAAQALSDSNYAQQFGWQAFVQAQLAQVHGGAQ